MTHTSNNRPSPENIDERAVLILGFRDRLDLDEELKLIGNLAAGRTVDDDVGGAYLAHTYPSWTKEDFRTLIAMLHQGAKDPDMEAWMRQRIERLKAD